MSRHSYVHATPGLLAACVTFIVLASSASAETLILNCTPVGDSHTFRVTVDPTLGIVSNEGGHSGRRWAALVTDKDIAWN
ncbi:MAG TPA: hypothetical protein VNW15_02205, partial [Rhizomicrobium sp.]|nr:hypothetical protein [Rhizomicrobium sp.]